MYYYYLDFYLFNYFQIFGVILVCLRYILIMYLFIFILYVYSFIILFILWSYSASYHVLCISFLFISFFLMIQFLFSFV